MACNQRWAPLIAYLKYGRQPEQMVIHFKNCSMPFAIELSSIKHMQIELYDFRNNLLLLLSRQHHLLTNNDDIMKVPPDDYF
jgi:hypothetical protein